jgi:hypothetical protein
MIYCIIGQTPAKLLRCSCTINHTLAQDMWWVGRETGNRHTQSPFTLTLGLSIHDHPQLGSNNAHQYPIPLSAIIGEIFVTAQLNQTRVGVTQQLVCNPPHPTTNF